jgi:hypothetical protein
VQQEKSLEKLVRVSGICTKVLLIRDAAATSDAGRSIGGYALKCCPTKNAQLGIQVLVAINAHLGQLLNFAHL